MTKIGIIGGTGFSEKQKNPETIKTDYGSIEMGYLEMGGKEVRFVARHGELQVPHLVNYRGNIQAMKLAGVDKIYAVSAAGRFHKDVLPGHLGIVDDVDWDDLNRIMTYCEEGLLQFATMDEPFSKALSHNLASALTTEQNKIKELYSDSPDLKFGVHGDGTYFNIQGPSFTPNARETRLRNQVINPRYIGQTLVPEVQLSQEMGIAYGALVMCVDHSKFPDPNAESVKHADGVMHVVKWTAEAAYMVLKEAIRRTDNDLKDPAHEEFKHSLHPSQVDLDKLRANGRPNLADILEKVVKESS